MRLPSLPFAAPSRRPSQSAAPVAPTRTTLRLSHGHLRLTCPTSHDDTARTIADATWDTLARAWEYRINAATVAAIREKLPFVEIDPAVIKAVSTPVVAASSDWRDAEPLEPMPVNATPYRHQVAAYNQAITMPSVALLMEMRTGKTLAALAAICRRFQRGEVQRVLIVAPSTVVGEWQQQIERFATVDYQIVAVGSGIPVKRRRDELKWATKRAAELRQRLFICLVNYEAVADLQTELAAFRPDAIIADESQRIKNVRAKMSKALHKLGPVARYRMILSGTPVTQNAVDLFSQYLFLDPSIFGRSFVSFRARYCRMGGYGLHQIVGYYDLDDLAARAHSIAFRCRLIDTYDMPDAVEQTRRVTLEPAARRAYDQLADSSATELSQTERVVAANVLVKLLRLQQLAGGFLPTEDDDGGASTRAISTAKLDATIEVIEELLDEDPKRKVVVFARFTAEVAEIAKRFEALDRGDVVTLTGATRNRSDVIRQFRDDLDTRVLVGQIQVAGVGIPLDVADTAIFYSTTFAFADYEQARARVMAVGKAAPRLYIHIVADDTVDAKVLSALARKRNVADDIVDNWRDLFARKDQRGGITR